MPPPRRTRRHRRSAHPPDPDSSNAMLHGRIDSANRRPQSTPALDEIIATESRPPSPARARSARQLAVCPLQLDRLAVRHLLQLRPEVGHAVGMVALQLLAVGPRDLLA